MANKANLANSVLFAPLSDSDTEMVVYTGDGALFPAPPFYLTISPKNKWSRKINSEIVLVTNRVADTLTITRAQKGTEAMEFSYGDLVANGIYVEDLDDVVVTTLKAMMPVGFVVTLGVNTNPATLYGFGTWTRIQGRVIVGLDGAQTEFDTLNETGGAKTHTLSVNEMPSHKHGLYGSMNVQSAINDRNGDSMLISDSSGTSEYLSNWQPTDANRGVGYTGGGVAHNNLQPYIVKYVWERTA